MGEDDWTGWSSAIASLVESASVVTRKPCGLATEDGLASAQLSGPVVDCQYRFRWRSHTTSYVAMIRTVPTIPAAMTMNREGCNS